MVSPAPLRALSAFEATARLSSVARAAQELGVSASAISQQIKWLERHLQRQLFQRSKRPMVLSEAGDRLFNAITGAFRDIDAALTRLEPTAAHRSLAIRTPPSLTAKWMIHQVADFRERFPGMELRLEATNEYIEFDWTGFDLDVRIGNGNWPGLYSYPLMTEEILPLCSPAYLKRGPLALGDLSEQTLIHSAKSPFTWSQWLHENNAALDREPDALRFDRSFLSIETAAQGQGVALESSFLAAREIGSGLLVPAVRNTQPLRIKQHWLVCPYQRLRSTKVRDFIHWLWGHLPNAWKTLPPEL